MSEIQISDQPSTQLSDSTSELPTSPSTSSVPLSIPPSDSSNESLIDPSTNLISNKAFADRIVSMVNNTQRIHNLRAIREKKEQEHDEFLDKNMTTKQGPIKGYKAFYRILASIFDHAQDFHLDKIHDLKDDLATRKFKDRVLFPTKWGFHFCEDPVEININGYPHTPDMIYAEIEALGTVVTRGTCSVTDLFRIVRMIPQEEFESMINGKKNSKGDIRYWTKGFLNDPSPEVPALQRANGGYDHMIMGVSHRDNPDPKNLKPTCLKIEEDGTREEGYCVNGIQLYYSSQWHIHGEEHDRQNYLNELLKFKLNGSKFKYGWIPYFYCFGYDMEELEYYDKLRAEKDQQEKQDRLQDRKEEKEPQEDRLQEEKKIIGYDLETVSTISE